MKPIVLVLLSLVLLSGGWLGVSGLPLLVAFVPMLMLSGRYGTSRREMWKMFGWSALTFGLWNIATVWWVWYAAAIGVITPTIIEGVMFGGVFTLFHYVSKRSPKALAYTLLVAGWIACEHIYTVGQISFPWLTLGNGFANDIALVQWYDTTGVFGGSLWVWICNIIAYEAIRSRSNRKWAAFAVAVTLPVGISLVKYYTYDETGSPVKATIVQPNIDPYKEKYSLPYQKQIDILLGLSAEAPSDADYIIMPETALHGGGNGLWENYIDSDTVVEQFREVLRERCPGAQFVMGANTLKRYFPGDKLSNTVRYREFGDYYYDVYNTSMAVDTGRTVQIYHKTKLLIGVEMTPFYDWIKKWDITILDLGGLTGQLGYDAGPKVFSHGGIKLGSAVCWEEIYGEYFGGFAKEGAEVMAIITNEGWWSDTPGYRQLFRYSQLRAVESRRAIARSANTGKSGFISQRGEELTSLGWDVRGTLTGEILTNDKVTFYSRFGDYIARICNLVFILSILYFIAYRAKKRSNLQ